MHIARCSMHPGEKPSEEDDLRGMIEGDMQSGVNEKVNQEHQD